MAFSVNPIELQRSAPPNILLLPPGSGLWKHAQRGYVSHCDMLTLLAYLHCRHAARALQVLPFSHLTLGRAESDAAQL